MGLLHSVGDTTHSHMQTESSRSAFVLAPPYMLPLNECSKARRSSLIEPQSAPPPRPVSSKPYFFPSFELFIAATSACSAAMKAFFSATTLRRYAISSSEVNLLFWETRFWMSRARSA